MLILWLDNKVSKFFLSILYQFQNFKIFFCKFAKFTNYISIVTSKTKNWF